MAARARNLGGRPEHRPTLKDRRVVTLLAGLGVSQVRIADTLGLAPKTLRKHYAAELQRGSALVEAQLVNNMFRMAQGSDAKALRTSIFLLQMRFRWSLYAPPRPREPIGKKEALQQAAEEGHPDWETLLP